MTAVSSAPGIDEPAPAHRRWASGALAVLGVLGCALAGLQVTTGVPGAVRAAATVAFMLLGPGWAVAGFLRRGSAALAWAVAAAVGCAVGALGAETMLLLGRWHPEAGLVVLAVLTVPVLLRHAIRPR